ncbi:MAG: TonB-dependent receptor [Pseudomonadota bacterium]|jgi:outer membrane receptor protein involved in Fe transport
MSGGANTALAIPLIAAALLIGAPAHAQERGADVDIPAARLDHAIRLLSRQSGTSIGFRDSAIAKLGVRAVRGKLTAAQALERMLGGTRLEVRRVATNTYLIERAALPPPPRPVVRPAPQPPATVPHDSVADEVIVTGSKRYVPLSVYPGGVQVIEGDTLSMAEGARGTDAIGARVASVVSTHLGPGRNKLFIRGIADSSFVGPTQATVGQYWGNSRITYSAPDPSLRLYDIRSIEVLEGPQGTLYGAGSLGGVVRVIPHAPDLNMTGGTIWGGTQAVQHGQPGVDGGAILNVPIVDDRLAFRALAFGSIDGGYIDDTKRKLKDVNEVRTIGGRAALRFVPADDWTIDLSGVGQRIDGLDSQYAERGGDGLSRGSSIAQPYRNDYWLGDLVVRKQWGQLELTSSFGYANQYVFEQFEGAALADSTDLSVAPSANAAPAAYVQTDHISMITAETRLARRGPEGTGWVIGVSLLHNVARVNRQMDEFYLTPAVSGSPTTGQTFPGVISIQPADTLTLTGVRNQVDEQTLYGETSIKPLDRLTLTFGGRLTHSRLSGDSEDVLKMFAFRVDPGASAARSETRLLPSAALAYRPFDQLTLFARYQEGFRPGGIAVRRDFVQRYKGDRVATTEAGARYSGRDFSLSLNASWSRWSDIQADLIDGFGFPTTANVGDGRVLSVGLAGRWQPVRGLSFDAAVYVNDSKVTAPAFATLPSDLVGANLERLPNVADATGRLGFAYATSLSSSVDLEVNGFGRYVGKSTLGIGPILGQLQGDYLDTGLEFRVGTKRRAVTLSLTNLLDARGNRFALGSPFLVRDRNQITPLQPRSVRLGFDAAF